MKTLVIHNSGVLNNGPSPITGMNVGKEVPNGGAAASVAVSWLNWQLRGDAESGRRFVGEHCGLCQDTRWSLERKQLPATGASK